MAHQRKLIRNAVVALLIAAGTTAEGRVYSSRVDPFKKGGTPAIAVYTLSEEVNDEKSGTAPRELYRQLQLEVVADVAGFEEQTIIDALDDLIEQIEDAMDADRWLRNQAADSVLQGTVFEILEGGKSDPLVARAALTYLVAYRTSPGATTAADDFLRVKAEHRIVGAVAENEAEDRFNVRTTP